MSKDMFSWLKKKEPVHKKTGGDAILNQDQYFTAGVLHACVVLPPDIFEELIGDSRLDAKKWYRALWVVQHNPKIKVSKLETMLEVSWPTAQVVKQRVLQFTTIPGSYDKSNDA